MNNEEFYDNEIAPELARLARKCSERGMSFMAAVEYEHGEIAETSIAACGFSWVFEMPRLALKCLGNLDKFIFAAASRARRRDDVDANASMVLKMLKDERGL